MNVNIIATRQPKYVCLTHIVSTDSHSILIELAVQVCQHQSVPCDYGAVEMRVV